LLPGEPPGVSTEIVYSAVSKTSLQCLLYDRPLGKEMVEGDSHPHVKTAFLSLCLLINFISGYARLQLRTLLVSNLVSGIDQYCLPSLERRHTFSHPVLRNVPLQVAFARGGDWILAGGDDGYARVFDSRTGQFLGRLDHGLGNRNFMLLIPFSSTSSGRIDSSRLSTFTQQKSVYR
jgi:WD40 repeat protein